MPYVTTDQLTERYGEAALVDLTDRAEPPAGVIDQDVIDGAVAGADALIDGYLKGRYKLPLAVTPELITELALPITFYKLHRNIAPDKARADYDDAKLTLRAIAAGTIRLDVEGNEPEASGTGGVQTSDRCRDMTPENLKGFV
jgi:phage gp36-like protein